jgi:hypothetical protein
MAIKSSNTEQNHATRTNPFQTVINLGITAINENDIFTVVTVLTTFFWVESPCGLVGRNRRFGDACCLHLQG